MITATNQFHEAIRQRNPRERILCLFSNPLYGEVPSLVSTMMAWTDEDISAQGVNITETMCADDELHIGETNSATISLTLINRDQLLTNYMVSGAYANDCTVYMGVETLSRNVQPPQGALCYAYMGYTPFTTGTLIEGYSTAPYLRIEGEGAPLQPPFAVHSVFVDEDYTDTGAKITCIGANEGEVWACTWNYGSSWAQMGLFTWGELSSQTWGSFSGEFGGWEGLSLSTFMGKKLQRLALKHLSFARRGTTLIEYNMRGTASHFEYRSCGVFRFDRPRLLNAETIKLNSFDKLEKSDKKVYNFLEGLTYPITLGSLFTQLCAEVGLTPAKTTFTNSTYSIAAKPEWHEDITSNEVFRDIAELACANVRMTRDGKISLGWFTAENYSLPQSMLFSTEIYDFEVKRIDKLVVEFDRESTGTTSKGIEKVTLTVGTGNNAYYIRNNPLIMGTDTVVKKMMNAIFSKLKSFAEYNPAIITAVSDWTVEAGDIIDLQAHEKNFSLPIFRQAITYGGIAVATYSNDGEENRKATD